MCRDTLRQVGYACEAAPRRQSDLTKILFRDFSPLQSRTKYHPKNTFTKPTGTRGLLQNCPELKFGFYTGRTPEDEQSKEGKRLLGQYRQKYGEPAVNEVLTREKMRAEPPQILFTNYSMLEYLLIRPTDSSLISAEGLKNLKFIVLDEAHIYRGALGIEIALLLRRLQGTANRIPQFVLTSATLGRGREDLKIPYL